METISENVQIQRVKSGRPKSIINKKEYAKDNYLNHKDKWQGDFHCPICNLLCSKSNKSRHFQSKVHQANLLKEC